MARMQRNVGLGLIFTFTIAGVAVGQSWCLEMLGIAPIRAQGLVTEAREPDDRSWVVKQRGAAKRNVLDQLRRGEIGLLHAAAWFRLLNEDPEKKDISSWQRLPGRSDEEKICRQVITWAENLANVESESQHRELLGRLEAELAEALQQDGRFELPEVQ